MDPVSHVAFGRTPSRSTGSAGSGSRRDRVRAWLGSLAPDVDAVFMPAGWDVYLRTTREGRTR